MHLWQAEGKLAAQASQQKWQAWKSLLGVVETTVAQRTANKVRRTNSQTGSPKGQSWCWHDTRGRCVFFLLWWFSFSMAGHNLSHCLRHFVESCDLSKLSARTTSAVERAFQSCQGRCCRQWLHSGSLLTCESILEVIFTHFCLDFSAICIEDSDAKSVALQHLGVALKEEDRIRESNRWRVDRHVSGPLATRSRASSSQALGISGYKRHKCEKIHRSEWAILTERWRNLIPFFSTQSFSYWRRCVQLPFKLQTSACSRSLGFAEVC